MYFVILWSCGSDLNFGGQKDSACVSQGCFSCLLLLLTIPLIACLVFFPSQPIARAPAQAQAR